MRIEVKNLSQEAIERANGCVCVNGSRLVAVSRREAVLEYPGARIELTAQELATFVKNFYEEGFEESVEIK